MATSSFRERIPAVLEQVQAIQSGAASVAHLVPFTPAEDPQLLEGVLFLKPEATDDAAGVNVPAVLGLLAEYVERWGLQVGGLSVLGATYLKDHDIIARHYGVINAISRGGRPALAESAEAKLQELFGEDLGRGAAVLGGHEFAARYPEFTPAVLNSLVDNVGSKKLAPGTYATKWVYGGQTNLLLNAFHLQQLEHFTAPRRLIIVLAVRASGSWKALRNEMLGPTDPAAGGPEALRRVVLERRAALGIPEVNRGLNAVHFSAGPLEGMVETARYFSDYGAGTTIGYEQTSFGRLLAGAGLTGEQIAGLADNPNLSLDGKSISAFDATEEVQPEEAIATLKRGMGV